MCKIELTLKGDTAEEMRKAMIKYLDHSIDATAKEIEAIDAKLQTENVKYRGDDKRAYLIALRSHRKSLQAAEIKIIEGELS